MLNEHRIKDKNGDTALDYIPTDEVKLRALFRKQQAQAAVSADDVASGNCVFHLSTIIADPGQMATTAHQDRDQALTTTRNIPNRNDGPRTCYYDGTNKANIQIWEKKVYEEESVIRPSVQVSNELDPMCVREKEMSVVSTCRCRGLINVYRNFGNKS